MLNSYIKIIYKPIKLAFLLKCTFFLQKYIECHRFRKKEEMRDLLCTERGVKDVNVIKKRDRGEKTARVIVFRQ